MIINRIKLMLFRRQFRKLNEHNDVYANNIFDSSKVTIGKMSYGGLTIDMFHTGREGLTIGSFVSIANGVKFILGGNHHTSHLSTFPFKAKVLGQKGETATKGPITIEDDVWIGSYSIILSGIRIGKGAVVAAGSVVVNDVEPYSIVGGNPAKFIRYRIDQKLINDAKDIDLNRITYGYTKQNVGLLYEPLDASVLKRIVESFRS